MNSVHKESQSAQSVPVRREWQQSAMPARHPVRDVLVIVVSAAVSGVVGTVLHRSGADLNIPWGLLAAFGLIFFSTWLARRRVGAIGVGFHLIFCSAVIWGLALTEGPGGDILVPVASEAFLTFFSQNAGYIWLFGCVLVQFAVLLFPHSFFEPAVDAPAHVVRRGRDRVEER
ncbi:MAG: alcohol dehydrogenase [Bifidobacteriaceae bacterium]|jgi:hypothetical protein|nr:alcohol dehydrogenase [Bifidobacteriaceae bacterium]MCI1978768.1 alcohol dehydrogenase [Bifidobacteriaceae bacterium]